MNYQQMMFYKSLEDDFLVISNHIYISEDNMKTYSFSLAKFIINVCSEIEILMKEICGIHEKYINFPVYSKSFLNKYRNIINFNVECIPWQKTFIPFRELDNGGIPQWWSGYNTIKHEAIDGIKSANLENAMQALAGLFTVTMYYYRGFKSENPRRIILPLALLPKVMTTDTGFKEFIVGGYVYDFTDE